MKKKLLLGFVLFVSLFLICGCGSSDSKENEVDDGSGKEEVEPSVQGTGNPDADLDGAYGEEQEIELYSDDTKIVFKNGNNKVVFYYSGNKITGQRIYYDYTNSHYAEIAYAALELDDDDDIEKAYIEGRYLVVEYKESMYENLTTEEVREIYSYLKEAKQAENN